MEKAIHEVGAGKLTDTEHIHATWTLAQQYPLVPRSPRPLPRLEVGGRDRLRRGHEGRPRGHCGSLPLRRARRGGPLSEHVQDMADRGLRVIGVAKAAFDEAELPDMASTISVSSSSASSGLEDPIRPTVPAAVRECHEAGIKVVMITGDYPATAQKIARQIGLGPGET